MLRLRSSFLLGVLLAGLALPASAQSVESIVDEMKARHAEQLETVDNYVIETNLYTSYNRKVTQNEQPTYETVTRHKGQSEMMSTFDSSPATTTNDLGYLDRLTQNATYAGTESVNGANSHVLRVDNPSAVNEDVSNEARSMAFYVHAEDYVPTRVHMTIAPSDPNQKESEFTMNFTDYRTVEGLTIPYVMEMQMDLGMSEQQRRQLEKLKKKLEQMPEQQREQMKSMMGDQFEQLQKMGTGEPMTINVQSVRVNEGIPEGIFDDSGGQ